MHCGQKKIYNKIKHKHKVKKSIFHVPSLKNACYIFIEVQINRISSTALLTTTKIEQCKNGSGRE